MSHTPGPWTIDREDKNLIVEKQFDRLAGQTCIATVLSDGNAPLIAAAPDLLEALKNIIRAFALHLREEAQRQHVSVNELCPCTEDEITAARAAIAKATGMKP